MDKDKQKKKNKTHNIKCNVFFTSLGIENINFSLRTVKYGFDEKS